MSVDKIRILLFIILISPCFLFAQVTKGWRIGGGLGYSFYYGTHMDYTITSNFQGLTELRNTYGLAFYKSLNSKAEWGLSARQGSVFTMKSSNTQGIEANFNELAFLYQRSFSGENLNGKKAICFNWEAGLGVMQYDARYFVYNTGNGFRNFSTIGLGVPKDTPKFKASKQFAAVARVGINIGLKLTQNLSIYLENNLNMTSGNLSGNLFRSWFIPPDSYWYSGVAIYFRPARREYCPRFY